MSSLKSFLYCTFYLDNIFYQSDKRPIAVTSCCRNKSAQSGNGMHWYRTEMLDSLMPMTAVSATMAMPRYFHILGFSQAQKCSYYSCARDNLRGQKSLGPLKMSLEMAHKVILPPKKNYIHKSFVNSGTLVFLCTRVLLCTVVVCCCLLLDVLVCCCVLLRPWSCM